MREQLKGTADAIEATIQAVEERTRELGVGGCRTDELRLRRRRSELRDGPLLGGQGDRGGGPARDGPGHRRVGAPPVLRQRRSRDAHLHHLPRRRGHGRAAELVEVMRRIGRTVIAVVPEGDTADRGRGGLGAARRRRGARGLQSDGLRRCRRALFGAPLAGRGRASVPGFRRRLRARPGSRSATAPSSRRCPCSRGVDEWSASKSRSAGRVRETGGRAVPCARRSDSRHPRSTTPDYVAYSGLIIDDIVLPDGRTFFNTLGGSGTHALIGMRDLVGPPGLFRGGRLRLCPRSPGAARADSASTCVVSSSETATRPPAPGNCSSRTSGGSRSSAPTSKTSTGTRFDSRRCRRTTSKRGASIFTTGRSRRRPN